jgi:hypothetical protein
MTKRDLPKCKCDHRASGKAAQGGSLIIKIVIGLPPWAWGAMAGVSGSGLAVYLISR